MATNLNYKWWARDLAGGISETPEVVDDEYVFANFTAARSALGDHFRSLKRQCEDAQQAALLLRKADMKDGEVAL